MESSIWSNFKKRPTSDLKKQIIMNYTNLVHYVIRRSKFRSVSIIDEKDYFQFGIEGLSEAIDRFNPDYGTKFETYAIQRIKGKIIDEIRKVQIKPRFDSTGESEIYYSNVSLNNSFDSDEGYMLYEILPIKTDMPDEILDKSEIKRQLMNATRELDEREKVVLTLYYYEDLDYKEIAEVLDVTVSRISQLHSGIMAKLRKKLTKELC
jgi:RNA polymerase sigma factor FliA